MLTWKQFYDKSSVIVRYIGVASLPAIPNFQLARTSEMRISVAITKTGYSPKPYLISVGIGTGMQIDIQEKNEGYKTLKAAKAAAEDAIQNGTNPRIPKFVREY